MKLEGSGVESGTESGGRGMEIAPCRSSWGRSPQFAPTIPHLPLDSELCVSRVSSFMPWV